MNVRDIVRECLKANGYDGLYVAGECACQLSDLAPCGERDDACKPGYFVPCNCGCGGFHIGEREAENA